MFNSWLVCAKVRCLWGNTHFFLQIQKSCPSDCGAACRTRFANKSSLCCGTQSVEYVKRWVWLAPEAQQGIHLLPAINKGAAKHANQFYWFLLAFVLPHASLPPIWYSPVWESTDLIQSRRNIWNYWMDYNEVLYRCAWFPEDTDRSTWLSPVKSALASACLSYLYFSTVTPAAEWKEKYFPSG